MIACCWLVGWFIWISLMELLDWKARFQLLVRLQEK